MPGSSRVFEVEHEGEALVVIPQGDALGFQESQLKTAIEDLHNRLNADTGINLIVDIGQASFLSSIIIGAIMALCGKARENGGKVALCNASNSVLDVIQIMKLDTVVPYYASRAKALDGFEE